jgi:hypothetical protein
VEKNQWSYELESLGSKGESLWKMTKNMMQAATALAPLQVPGGLALSDSEKAKDLADSLEAQFQPADEPPDPAFTEIVDVAMRT